MRLHGPHEGVELVGVQTVAVGLALRSKHEVVQFLDAEFAPGPLFEDAGLQKEARVDVHHDLRGVLQERVQHGQPVGTGGPIKGGVSYVDTDISNEVVPGVGKFAQRRGRGATVLAYVGLAF